MKSIQLLIYFIFSGLIWSCGNYSDTGNSNEVVADKPHIEFEVVEYDFGKIPYQGKAEYAFVFMNKGNEPLVLQNVKTTCGCTVPEWPKEPLSPGESAKIIVKYNTRISGSFSKGITVYSNAENPTVHLRIKGEVEKAAADRT